MTLDELKAEVCAYLNRRPEDFLRNGVDLFTTALNRVRRMAQKRIDFEFLRCQVTTTIPLAGQVDIQTATYTPLGGSAVTVRINRIERAFIPYNNALRPIDFLNRATVSARDQRRYDDRLIAAILSRSDLPVHVTLYPVFVRNGLLAYLYPNTSPTYLSDPQPVTLDIVRWADDYISTTSPVVVTNTTPSGPLPIGSVSFYLAGTFNGQALYCTAKADTTKAVIYYDTDDTKWRISNQLNQANNYWQSTVNGVNGLITFDFEGVGFNASASPINATPTLNVSGSDFFLTDCEDWLFMSVCRQMQFYLKDESRTAITMKQLDDAWMAVVAWNASISESSIAQPEDLD